MTALVTGNLPLVAGAPNGIAKLRELILALAVGGKLVAQDPSEECAQALLEETKLVRNSLSKRPKCLATVDEDIELPAGWARSLLANLALKLTDGSHNPPPDAGVGFPMLSSQNVRDGFVDFSSPSRFVAPEGFEKEDARTRATPGDVLLTIVASIGRSAVVPRGAPRFSLQRSVAVIQTLLVPEYLCLFLRSPRAVAYYWRHAAGTAQKGIYLGKLGELAVDVPPLAEQHRIVAKVDELMALCDRLEAQQADAEAAHAKLVEALLASLTQARDAADFRASWHQLAEHFHALFTTEASVDALKQTIVHLAVMGKLVAPTEGQASSLDFLAEINAARAQYEAVPGRRTRQRADQGVLMAPPPYPAPAGWEWRNLGSLLFITGGVTLGRKLAGRELVSLPYLRVANVQRGFLVLDQVKEIEVPADEVEKYKLAPGDLLTTEGGDWDKVGRTAIWQGEMAQCLHQNHVFRSRPYTDKFSSRWVELYLNSPPARDYFAGSSKQTTNLASINMTQLRACAFPVPPLAEQQQIVAVVDDLLERCNQLIVGLGLSCQRHEQLASVLVEQAVA